MHLPAEDLIYIVSIASLIFLIAPCFLVLYVSFNNQKKKYAEEKMILRKAFEREISRVNIEVREQTMQAIGADLHDNIGQLLGLTALTLRSVELNNPLKAKEKINTVDQLISRSIFELRQVGKVIQGEQLVKNGIAKAIKHELFWIEKSGSFSVDLVCTEPINEYNSGKDLILFRLFQEILNNIIKHSEASHITVQLGYKNALLTLSVKDDGVGFSEVDPPDNKGMGLLNMERRAAIIGAQLSVNTGSGKGTEISVTVPYPL